MSFFARLRTVAQRYTARPWQQQQQQYQSRVVWPLRQPVLRAGRSSSNWRRPTLMLGAGGVLLATVSIAPISSSLKQKQQQQEGEGQCALEECRSNSEAQESKGQAAFDIIDDLVAGKIPGVLLGIIGLHALIFLMFQLHPNLMLRHFTFVSGEATQITQWYKAVTSMFSHATFLHLAFNSYALYTVAPVLLQLLGTQEFLAFYLSAGVFSSFLYAAGQHLIANVTRNHTLLRVPSLGASGAVFACFFVFAKLFPHAEFQLIFFPFFNFTSQTMMMCAVAFDAIGFLRSFRGSGFANLAHMAHLGGAGFGFAYATFVLEPRIAERRKARLEHQRRQLASLGRGSGDGYR